MRRPSLRLRSISALATKPLDAIASAIDCHSDRLQKKALQVPALDVGIVEPEHFAAGGVDVDDAAVFSGHQDQIA